MILVLTPYVLFVTLLWRKRWGVVTQNQSVMIAAIDWEILIQFLVLAPIIMAVAWFFVWLTTRRPRSKTRESEIVGQDQSSVTIQKETRSSMSGSSNPPSDSRLLQGLLSRNVYLIRGCGTKLVNSYDILDPDTNEHLGIVKPGSSTWYNMLPVVGDLLPAERSVYEDEVHRPVLVIRRAGWCFGPVKVWVYAGNGPPLGYFRRGYFLGQVGIYGPDGRWLGQIGGHDDGKSKPKRKFLDMSVSPTSILMHGRVIGTKTGSWTSLGKGLLTGGEWTVTLDKQAPASFSERAMLLASGLAERMLPTNTSV